MRKASYAEIRPQLATGMPVFFKGDGIASAAIMAFSEFSHVATVWRDQDVDATFIAEARPPMYCLHTLSHALNHGGQAFVWLVPIGQLSQWIIRKGALGMVDRPYDTRGVIANAFGRVKSEDTAMFCSEAHWWLWTQARVVRPCGNIAPRPGDIIPWAERQGVIGELVEIVREGA